MYLTLVKRLNVELKKDWKIKQNKNQIIYVHYYAINNLVRYPLNFDCHVTVIKNIMELSRKCHSQSIYITIYNGGQKSKLKGFPSKLWILLYWTSGREKNKTERESHLKKLKLRTLFCSEEQNILRSISLKKIKPGTPILLLTLNKFCNSIFT